MMRDWRRLYRLRGFTPFGILLVVLLAVLLASDRVTDRWSSAAQRQEDAERLLATMDATLVRSRQIDAALTAARTRLAAVSGRVVTAPDARAAGERLATSAEKWLVSMGASGKARKALEGGARDAPDTASAEIAIRVMPQQLLRILDKWQQAPVAMRLVRLEVAVDNSDAPTALEGILQIEGVYQRPETGSASAPGPGPTSRSVLKSVTADRARPVATGSAKAQDAR